MRSDQNGYELKERLMLCNQRQNIDGCVILAPRSSFHYFIKQELVFLGYVIGSLQIDFETKAAFGFSSVILVVLMQNLEHMHRKTNFIFNFSLHLIIYLYASLFLVSLKKWAPLTRVVVAMRERIMHTLLIRRKSGSDPEASCKRNTFNLHEHHHHHYHHHHHHHHLLLLLLFLLFLSPCGIRPDPGVNGSLLIVFKEVIESATLNPLCYPNSYWAENL